MQVHTRNITSGEMRELISHFISLLWCIYEHENELYASQMKSIDETLEAHKEMR